jgi:hypothetical protein
MARMACTTRALAVAARACDGATMQLAGIAHVQLTVSDLARSRPFYSALCQHFEMHCQYDLEANATESGILYFIGGKTGLAICAAKPEHADAC